MITPPGQRRVAGFTLIELVMTIVIAGIVATMLTVFIVRPIQGYADLERRSGLADAADSALRLMARDIRNALPNSVRVNAGANALEMLNVVDAGRYRVGGPGTPLRFNQAIAQFDLTAAFANTAPGDIGGVRLAVNNTTSGPSGAYGGAGLGVMTGPMTLRLSAPVADEQVVTFRPPGTTFTFSQSSPRQRIFLVNQPIYYTCGGAPGLLTRTLEAAVAAAIPAPTPAGASEVVADQVTACSFRYVPGSNTRAGLVTITLTLGAGGENVTQLRQVRVDNAP